MSDFCHIYEFYTSDCKNDELYRHDNAAVNPDTVTLQLIPQHNEMYISCFDMDAYVNDIYKSYQYDIMNTHSQFHKDYHRQTIKLNGMHHASATQFTDALNKILTNNTYQYCRNDFDLDDYIADNFVYYDNRICDTLDIPERNMTLYQMTYNEIIMLLCCQSSFYLPYRLLTNIYNLNTDDLMLVSNSENKSRTTIDIVINQDKIILDLTTVLYIKSLSSGTTTHSIDATITMDISKQNIDDRMKCIFSWNVCEFS